MIVHLWLRISACEASSQLRDTGPQWTVTSEIIIIIIIIIIKCMIMCFICLGLFVSYDYSYVRKKRGPEKIVNLFS